MEEFLVVDTNEHNALAVDIRPREEHVDASDEILDHPAHQAFACKMELEAEVVEL